MVGRRLPRAPDEWRTISGAGSSVPAGLQSFCKACVSLGKSKMRASNGDILLFLTHKRIRCTLPVLQDILLLRYIISVLSVWWAEQIQSKLRVRDASVRRDATWVDHDPRGEEYRVRRREPLFRRW